MCNDCDCEFEYLCSIKGYLPFGACCKKCTTHDERQSCEHYVLSMPLVEVQPTQEFPVLTKKSIKLYP